MGFGKWDLGLGNGNLGAGRNEASKDIAESPTRSGTPKRKLKVENGKFRVQSSESKVRVRVKSQCQKKIHFPLDK